MRACGAAPAWAYPEDNLQGDAMTTFDERQRAHEAKFARDADLNFKAEARRNRLLGEWAAGLLGLSGEEAKAYALSVVTADFEHPGEEDVFAKLEADLGSRAD